METKTYRAAVEFKGDGETGEFEAVFATLGVIDHDGDVTVPGAFGEQRVLVEPWNHNYQAPPVGKGVIQERGNEAIVVGHFFTDTAAGLEHYRVAKRLGDMQEWSYTFRVLDAEPGMVDGQPVRMLKRMDVAGVGQVTRGAGIGTRTMALKSEGAGFSDEDVQRLKALLSDAGDGEGEGPGPGPKPSGVPVRDVQARVNILRLEGEVLGDG